jgi:hypothetical protein
MTEVVVAIQLFLKARRFTQLALFTTLIYYWSMAFYVELERVGFQSGRIALGI